MKNDKWQMIHDQFKGRPSWILKSNEDRPLLRSPPTSLVVTLSGRDSSNNVTRRALSELSANAPAARAISAPRHNAEICAHPT
jgi:hypothetical protein